MRLVLVEWMDSFGCSSEWTTLSECAPEPIVCRSVGWLLHDGDDLKVVVPHLVQATDQGCGDMTIPSKSVLRMVDLNVPEAELAPEGAEEPAKPVEPASG